MMIASHISQCSKRSDSKLPIDMSVTNALEIGLIVFRALMPDLRKLRDQIKPSNTDAGDGKNMLYVEYP